MDFTRERFEYTRRYVREVFGAEDEHLAGLMAEAVTAGLPDIAVSPDVGRLLMLLTSMTEARMVVELGTLAGYSTIWLARALAEGPPPGKVITVELEEKHARFAEEQMKKAGVADRVEVRRGAALDVLPQLEQELGPESVDVFFFDAIKREYPDYWRIARRMLKRGGLLLADNVLGANWWIDMEGHPDRDAVDRFNRDLAAAPDLDVTCVPLREGVLVARKR
jgi:predicted O-methyltransferase YrrM